MPIDDTLAEGLQAMSAWLDYLEEQKARYRGQLERARRAQGTGGEQQEAPPPKAAWEAWEDVGDAGPAADWETWEEEDSPPQDTWQTWASADEHSEARAQEPGADVLFPDDELRVGPDMDAWDAPTDETPPYDETGIGSAESVPDWFDAQPEGTDGQPEGTDALPAADEDDDAWM